MLAGLVLGLAIGGPLLKGRLTDRSTTDPMAGTI
jgi:hypothetical protein